MNAQALKKFVDENQKLAAECGNLLGQCKKWERECLLYHQDRDALMEFGNESDERAREAEARVLELEEELGRMSQELRLIGTEEVDSFSRFGNFKTPALVPPSSRRFQRADLGYNCMLRFLHAIFGCH